MQTTEAGTLYAGADLHGNNVFLSLIDGGGKEVYRRRVKANLEAVNEALDPYWPRIEALGVESTFNWYWLVDGLQEAGHVVHLANTAAMQPYSGLKHGDDRSDARHLAHLLRLGILPTGFIYPRQQRAARDLARHRMRLVQTRSRAIIAVENVLSCHTGGRLSSNQIKRLGGDDIEGLQLHADVRLALHAQIALIGALDAQIGALERRLQ